MAAKKQDTAKLFLDDAQSYLRENLDHMVHCLGLLSDREIWWRPNAPSNSAGNLVLHLCGNIRQWIISGLGGAQDIRHRDLEFSARGPIPRRALVAQLRKTVGEACRVLKRLPPGALHRRYSIQGFHLNGLHAVAHVFEHFSYHTGQIVYITKLTRGRDLRLVKLPPYSEARATPQRPVRAAPVRAAKLRR